MKSGNNRAYVTKLIDIIKNYDLYEKLFDELFELPKCREKIRKKDDITISQARDRAL